MSPNVRREMNVRRPRLSARRSLTGAFVSAFVMVGFLADPVQAAPAYKGMSYTPWSSTDATSTGADQSMLNLQVVGANTVALNVFWFQDNIGSTSITQDTTRYSITQTAARHAIQDIRARGMNVILKPQVDVRDGSWRRS